MIDLGRAFRSPFDDSDWVKKTLLGFLWVLLTVTAPAVYGAQVEYIRSVSRGEERLPDWDNLGQKWVEGLLIGVAGFIYFLPVAVLGIVFLAPAIIGLIGSGGDSDALAGMFVGSLCIFWLIALVYSIAVSILFNAAIVHYAMSQRFGAFFEFGQILGKVRSGGGYWTAWLYTILISFAGSAATSVLSMTGIGALLYPAIIYLMVIMTGHILGQWAREAYAVSVPAAPASPQSYAPPTYEPPTYAPPAPPVYPPVPPLADEPPAEDSQPQEPEA